MNSHIDNATQYIKDQQVTQAKVGIILGSGLGGLVDSMTDVITVKTESIPDFPASTVEGHDGMLLSGKINGIPLLAVKGRTHLYEGYSPDQVVMIVRILKKLGVETLIVTNSAGGANPTFNAGDLMIITDHINMMFKNPLIGKNDDELGPRFPDMSEPYSEKLISIAEEKAIELGIDIRKGVYCGVLGPNYETAAEVKMIQVLGGDAIGMSTVPDVIAARHAGMDVLGISCVTNLGTGLSSSALSHAEVTEIANQSAERFKQLIIDILPML